MLRLRHGMRRAEKASYLILKNISFYIKLNTWWSLKMTGINVTKITNSRWIFKGNHKSSSKFSVHESRVGLDNLDIKYQMNFWLMLEFRKEEFLSHPIIRNNANSLCISILHKMNVREWVKVKNQSFCFCLHSFQKRRVHEMCIAANADLRFRDGLTARLQSTLVGSPGLENWLNQIS